MKHAADMIPAFTYIVTKGGAQGEFAKRLGRTPQFIAQVKTGGAKDKPTKFPKKLRPKLVALLNEAMPGLDFKDRDLDLSAEAFVDRVPKKHPEYDALCRILKVHPNKATDELTHQLERLHAHYILIYVKSPISATLWRWIGSRSAPHRERAKSE
jgi:hypothetical protein